jgi:desulfoferrodoxin-like iron-binding protein
MARYLIFAVLTIAAAVTLTLGNVARGDDTGTAAQANALEPEPTYTQAKPYTKDFFGPWNADVAKVHLPQITFTKSDNGLNVRVQIDDHPMNASIPHYIMWISLTDGQGNILGTKTFAATDPAPAVAVFLLQAPPDKIRAFERCNIHGIWMSEMSVP